MEDAMVINKSSYERGFADACIYKSEVIDLVVFSTKGRVKRDPEHYFGSYNHILALENTQYLHLVVLGL